MLETKNHQNIMVDYKPQGSHDRHTLLNDFFFTLIIPSDFGFFCTLIIGLFQLDYQS